MQALRQELSTLRPKITRAQFRKEETKNEQREARIGNALVCTVCIVVRTHMFETRKKGGNGMTSG
jgi:hypothetical protein